MDREMLKRAIGINRDNAWLIGQWLLATIVAPAVLYWLICHHLSVDGDNEELLATALAAGGLVTMVIVSTRRSW